MLRIKPRLNDGECTLSFEDDGSGIEEDLATHVFKIFRKSIHTSNAAEGSEFELAVVSAIARAQAG